MNSWVRWPWQALAALIAWYFAVGRRPLVARDRRWWVGTVCLGVAGMLGACGANQGAGKNWRPGDSSYLVRSLTVEGRKHADKDGLRAAMATKVLSLNPFGTNRPLNRYELHNDISRIETFYQLHGYFDAKVLGPPDVTYFDDVHRASVTFHVEEGSASVVREMRILDARTGSLDPVTEAASGFGYLVSRIRNRLPMRLGQVFSYDKMTSSAALMRRRLQELGYARAKVEARAYVSREKHRVMIVYSIDPGSVCVFGDVTYSGNDRVPDRVLKKAADITKGTDFRPSILEAARNRLYGLGEFEVVDIRTDLDRGTDASVEVTDDERSRRDASEAIARALPAGSDPFSKEVSARYRAVRPQWESSRVLRPVRGESWRADALSARLNRDGYAAVFAVSAVPHGMETLVAQRALDFSKLQVRNPYIKVYIHVAESAASTYRFGVGGEIDSGRWAAFARGNATWRDIFGPLNTFKADLRVGYAWLPTPFQQKLKPQQLRNRGLIAHSSLEYRRPQLLWNAWDLHAGVRVDKDVELAYNLLTVGGDIGINRQWGDAYRLNLGYSVDINRERSMLDGGMHAYRLAWLNAQVSADFRDDPMEPHRGAYLEFLVELGDPFTGEFAFLKLRPDVRGYIPITRRLTLALRGTVGFLISIPGDNPVPISHRLYEGGATSFRGVPYRRLSPHQYRLNSGDGSIPSLSVYDSAGQCQQALEALHAGGVGAGYRCRPEPTGGFFSAVFSVEPRYELGKDWLYGAVFLDAGTVQDQVIPTFGLGGNAWQLAVGGGLRIKTPLGPIRADIAYRITTADAYANLSRVVFFIAIGEAF